jgi:hypothetical protein
MMLLRQHLSLQPRATACLHLPRAAAAAGEGSGSAAAAGLDVPSSMTMVGSVGLWLRLPPWNCRKRADSGDSYIPSGELLGFPPFSSTHSGTMHTEPSGDSVRRFHSVWFVLVNVTPCKFFAVKNKSLLCSCKALA